MPTPLGRAASLPTLSKVGGRRARLPPVEVNAPENREGRGRAQRGGRSQRRAAGSPRGGPRRHWSVAFRPAATLAGGCSLEQFLRSRKSGGWHTSAASVCLRYLGRLAITSRARAPLLRRRPLSSCSMINTATRYSWAPYCGDGSSLAEFIATAERRCPSAARRAGRRLEAARLMPRLPPTLGELCTLARTHAQGVELCE